MKKKQFTKVFQTPCINVVIINDMLICRVIFTRVNAAFYRAVGLPSTLLSSVPGEYY